MLMWKIPSTGVTSEDFLNQKAMNDPRAFYGKLWRFSDDQAFKEASVEESDAQNSDYDPSGESGGSTEDAPGLDSTEPLITAEALQKMPREQLAEVAAALGVVKLDLPKAKLIEAILEKRR